MEKQKFLFSCLAKGKSKNLKLNNRVLSAALLLRFLVIGGYCYGWFTGIKGKQQMGTSYI